MRQFILLPLLGLCLCGSGQTTTLTAFSTNYTTELTGGIITGQIKLEDGQPAAFVTIRVKEVSRSTVSDENGNFRIGSLKEGNYTIEVSIVGQKPQLKTISLRKDETIHISFMLTQDISQLTEVVISSGRSLNRRPLSIGKLDIPPMDLPQSIALVGSGLIREQQMQRLSDAVKNINGVYVSSTRGAVQESFGARGYTFGSGNLFKNGARINSGVMPELSGLERVEVLKGSAAILFGQVAPGGIMNLVTRQPKFTRSGEVSMRVGSFALYKPAFDVYGPLSTSIAYRLNGTYEHAGSFRDQVHSERYYINPSFLFRLSNQTDLTVEGDYLRHEFTPDFGTGTLDGTRIANLPRSRFLGTPWQYNITKQATATATLRHQFDESWKLNTSISYQRYDRDYYAVERVAAQANGDWTRTLGRVLTSEDYVTAQANLNGKFTTGNWEHNLLAGADADHYYTTNHDFSFPGVAGLPAGSYDKINILEPTKFTARTDMPAATAIRKRIAPVDRTGIYVQDLIRLSDRFNILAGIRWSSVLTRGIDSTNLLTNLTIRGYNRHDQSFSPRLGVVYKPTETTSFFLSYANSFVVNSGQDMDGNSLKPSVIDQYEAGVKNELLHGLLSANLTLYRIRNNNLAQTAPFLKDGTPNNNTNIKQLTGETTSDGVELDLAAHPLPGLDIIAGYSYNYMRYTKTDTTAGSYKTGERLVGIPAHTANASVFYTVSNGILSGIKTGVTVAYTGARFGGWNTDVLSTRPVTYRSRIFDVSGYTTIDLSIGYTYKKLSVMGKVSNLTNTLNYAVHENYSINPIPPAQLVATVVYKF